METTQDASVGLRPPEVAKLFGVHLRTVFRWKNRGLITSVDGRIVDSDLEEKAELRNNTIPRHEAVRLLGVRHITLNRWAELGYLKKVTVMGEIRIIPESLKDAPKIKTGPPHALRSYRTMNFLVDLLSTTHSTLKKCAGTNFSTVEVDGKKVVTPEEVTRLVKLVRSSYTLPEARHILGVSREEVRKMVKIGKLKSFVLLTVTRVTSESVSALVPYYTTSRKLRELGIRRRKN